MKFFFKFLTNLVKKNTRFPVNIIKDTEQEYETLLGLDHAKLKKWPEWNLSEKGELYCEIEENKSLKEGRDFLDQSLKEISINFDQECYFVHNEEGNTEVLRLFHLLDDVGKTQDEDIGLSLLVQRFFGATRSFGKPQNKIFVSIPHPNPIRTRERKPYVFYSTPKDTKRFKKIITRNFWRNNTKDQLTLIYFAKNVCSLDQIDFKSFESITDQNQSKFVARAILFVWIIKEVLPLCGEKV